MAENEKNAVEKALGINDLTPLITFVKDPRKFLFGFVATVFLEGTFKVVTEILDAIIITLAGSEPTKFNAPGEQLGLADVPVLIAELVLSGFEPVVRISTSQSVRY